ncbi:preprotein translocase subunit SecG [Clostridium cavendishii DSM 21758]|uniref:Protein-export membrane protein SecG n=1 Tax=Clostridium cavendishii DSM 21758 TaxID=1121302 RepID=A0A1M6MLY3_9CLOT|nr:preprotein translocase subunit SecG [Clostridium cavendishii]SHJ84491.1 preprotein translocase subunit SecG [Clostridium cavendishii DSM 21758]
MRTAMLVLEAILGIVIIVSILLQPTKADALSGLIQGQSDTFFAKNKSRTKEAMLVKITFIAALLFAVNTIAINLIK